MWRDGQDPRSSITDIGAYLFSDAIQRMQHNVCAKCEIAAITAY